jgi:hypothetical protein
MAIEIRIVIFITEKPEEAPRGAGDVLHVDVGGGYKTWKNLLSCTCQIFALYYSYVIFHLMYYYFGLYWSLNSGPCAC